MTVVRSCVARERRVELDVSAKDFLEYRLTCRGAQASFAIVDDLQDVLTPADRMTAGEFGIEWHPQESWDGADTHNFRAAFLNADSYTLKISHCRSNGSVIRVLRNCTYSRSDRYDTAIDSIRVYAR